MGKSFIRVLLVDDFKPWRDFVSLTLQGNPWLQITAEVSDGLEAVHKARDLKPDLILMDVGLPTLDGIEAARQIIKYAPKSIILMMSENRSRDIAEEALRSGGGGYLVKSDAAKELLPAVESVLRGKQYVSAGLGARVFPETLVEVVHPAHEEAGSL